MTLPAVGQALQRIERAIPVPGTDEVLLRVSACGVCRTDLPDLGELPAERLPAPFPGTRSVAPSSRAGADVSRASRSADRRRRAWLGGTCRRCP